MNGVFLLSIQMSHISTCFVLELFTIYRFDLVQTRDYLIDNIVLSLVDELDHA